MATQTSTQEKKNKSFRFLDLPPELRVRVYEHYFANRQICVHLTNSRDPNGYVGKPRTATCTGLLRTCKIVNREATKTVEETVALTLTMCIGPFYLSSLKKVTVAVNRLWIAKDVCLQLFLDESSKADLFHLLENWLAATNGGALVERLSIQLTHRSTTQKTWDRLLRKLQDGLSSNRTKGRVVGRASADGSPLVNAGPFYEMIEKLNQ